MDEAKRQLIHNWLTRAKSDLTAAQTLYDHAQLDTAIYHCQQTGEKVIKAFLIFCDEPLHRTHDVESLILIANSYDDQFVAWHFAGSLLTPYATAYRYPAEPFQLQPTQQEFEHILLTVKALYEFVLSRLPADTHP
jgi:HEPN domain-containing protein